MKPSKNPPKKPNRLTGIQRYDAPAGGWGALKATAQAVADQMRIAEAPVLLLRTNKPDGFDCPGCAWPDKAHTSTFQFCENGAKAVTWEATKKRVTPEFFAAHTVTELLTWSDHQLEDAGRLTHPLRYDATSDTYQPISWDAAFAHIGRTLSSLPAPDMVEFYTSGRASNEAAFLLSVFAREFGTNNFPDCSNMCHEATSVGLPQAIGIGKGTVSLDDFDACDLIISMGHNPGTNHPRMMGTLHECARRGVPIIVFNPLRERALERFADPQDPIEMGTFGSTRIASTYYQVKVGGDAAALKGIMKALVEADRKASGVLDHAFIAEHTNGFDAYVQDLDDTAWADIEQASGLARAELEQVAAAYARSKATIVTYGMGITQHARGTQNVQQIAALLLMRGNFGKPGAGICPLRGHSNVQGNRSVGITEKIDPVMFDNFEKTFGFRPPERHGHDAVDAMKAMVNGEARALICLGGNLAMALSDTSQCEAGMRRLDLAVHMNTKLNRSQLLIGRDAIILPVLGRTESDVQASGAQSITVEDSMSMVHASRGKLAPASEHLRSEPAIIAAMAAATLPASRVPWRQLVEDYGRIRDLIEQVYPDFHGYNERILKPGGFRLPLPPTERIWKTRSGRAEFLPFKGIQDGGLQEDPAGSPGSLTLTTLRSHDQYNTTIYGLDDRYRGVFGRRDVLFMNASDLTRHGLEPGDDVELQTDLPGQSHRRLRLTAIAYDIAAGSVGAYYPEANDLCPLDYQDKQSGTPSYKSIPVLIRKVA
ncbi:FdhF/YdeP family oxidoreductase [Achromobacter sp. MY14]|uniref:FdhF/YdeP family oxidoreductase n=1 Tax=unclassified Achromobacter TaxID=2626865 RepID=UPI001E518034|nr:FdhF/YdeP family oxidoreductase [Achromobacter sp. MY14]MCD0498412.1 FdhF/YdeP family oxidoreductase [Achromobacter sp. MY14]